MALRIFRKKVIHNAVSHLCYDDSGIYHINLIDFLLSKINLKKINYKKGRVFMPSKKQFYTQMADQAAKQISGSYQSWISFLQTAGRLYKYPYNEQVKIIGINICFLLTR